MRVIQADAGSLDYSSCGDYIETTYRGCCIGVYNKLRGVGKPRNGNHMHNNMENEMYIRAVGLGAYLFQMCSFIDQMEKKMDNEVETGLA